MIGLVQKFKIERNAQPYPEHEGEYFVLFPARDHAAMQALYVYAATIAADNPQLARELKSWLDGISKAKLTP